MNASEVLRRPSAELLDRTPPHSVSSERALLAAMTLAGEPAGKAMTLLAPGDFHVAEHRKLFEHLCGMIRDGQKPEPALLRARYERNGGGYNAALVGELFEGSLAVNVEHHAAVLIDCARRRDVILYGLEAVHSAYENGGDVTTIAHEAAAAMTAVSERGKERRGSAELVRLSDVTPQKLRWLWPGRFPAGMLSLIVGCPGLSKSMLSLDIAARVSRGLAWPDESGHAPIGATIILSAEDSLDSVIRPRLDKAGADPEKIVALTGVKDTKARQSRCFYLARDMPALEEAICRTPGARLIVVDPVAAFVPGLDSHKNSDVRSALLPLSQLAEASGATIVAISHLSKGGQGPAVNRVAGSLAWAAAARAVWLVARAPDNGDARLLLCLKSNLSRDHGAGLSYSVVDDGSGVPALAWSREPVSMTAEEVLSREAVSHDRADPTERTEAAQWLLELLADGPQLAKPIPDLAKQSGHAWRTVCRAKKELGIRSYKGGQRRGCEVVLVPHRRCPPRRTNIATGGRSLPLSGSGKLRRRWQPFERWGVRR